MRENAYIIGKAGDYQSVILLNNEFPHSCFSRNLPATEDISITDIYQTSFIVTRMVFQFL